jgi:hypothetical protein
VKQYPAAADSTLPTKKRKFEQMQESPKKVLIEEIVDESKYFQEVVSEVQICISLVIKALKCKK